MQAKSLAVVLLRVVAVIIVAYGLEGVSQSLVFMMKGSGDWATAGFQGIQWLLVLGVLLPCVFGLVIWCLAPWLAALAVRKLPVSMDVDRLTLPGLMQAALLVVGVWLLVQTLPYFVGLLIQIWTATSHDSGPVHLSRRGMLSPLVTDALRCVLGLYLVVGSRSLVRILQRLRYAGTQKSCVTNKGE